MKANLLKVQKHIKNAFYRATLKKSLSLFTLGILLTLNTSAKELGTPNGAVIDEVNKTIKEQIKFPLLSTYVTEQKVNVVFTVNEAGHVNLVIVNTFNQSLKKTIESQFAKLTLNNLKANNAYSIVFNFKTI